MLTPFGKKIRKLRIDHVVTMKAMADALGLSSAFLSAVETGRKAIPENLIGQVADYFRLDAAGREELRELATQSVTDVKVSLTGANDRSRELAVMFARRFEELDTAEVEKLIQTLRGDAK